MNSPAKSGGAKTELATPRDFFGYGPHPPHPRWPGDARIAINFNLNFEAGGERSLLEGDDQSEDLLSDIGFPAYFGVRSPIVETVFEYGPRVGVWRLLRIFKKFDVKISILGVVRAMQQCPAAVKAFLEDGHEIVSHGWRWIDYHNMDEAEEREHVRLAIEGIRKLTGRPPVGWFNGRPSANTRRLLVEAGGFLYDSDALNDELPYWEVSAAEINQRCQSEDASVSVQCQEPLQALLFWASPRHSPHRRKGSAHWRELASFWPVEAGRAFPSRAHHIEI
jgi:allantoinase